MRAKVLSDHRRQGKRLIPRMADFHILEVKWAEDMLPEFLWLGLLNAMHGQAAGAEIALLVARAARAAHRRGMQRWFALLGEYAVLDDHEKADFLTGLGAAGVLQPLREGLRVLSAFYPENPLRDLFRGEEVAADDATLRRLKAVVAPLFPRAGTEATRVQANALCCFRSRLCSAVAAFLRSLAAW